MIISRFSPMLPLMLALVSCGDPSAGEQGPPIKGEAENPGFQTGSLDRLILSSVGEEAFQNLVMEQSDAEALQSLLREAGFKWRFKALSDCWAMERRVMHGPLTGGVVVTVTQCPDRKPQTRFFQLPPF